MARFVDRDLRAMVFASKVLAGRKAALVPEEGASIGCVSVAERELARSRLDLVNQPDRFDLSMIRGMA